MKRIRIDRHRTRRGAPDARSFPWTPRDPDVVRAKALARAAHQSQKVPNRETARAAGCRSGDCAPRAAPEP